MEKHPPLLEVFKEEGFVVARNFYGFSASVVSPPRHARASEKTLWDASLQDCSFRV
jgi:hypothetical protein